MRVSIWSRLSQIRRLELLLDLFQHAPAVVIVDLQAERLGAPRDRLADAPHTDDAEPLAEDAMPEHPRRRPAGPFGGRIAQVGGPLGQAGGARPG